MAISLTCTRCWVEMTLPALPPEASVPCCRCGSPIRVSTLDDDYPVLQAGLLEAELVEEPTPPDPLPARVVRPVSGLPASRSGNSMAALGAVLALVLIVGGAVLALAVWRGRPATGTRAETRPRPTPARTEKRGEPVVPLPAAEPIRPTVLTGGGVSPDWRVLFRSADPRHWDRQVDQADGYARPLSTAPDNIRYLRLRRNTDYVIVEIRKPRLTQNHDDGRYGWHGGNDQGFNGGHLGVYDRRLRYKDRGDVCIHSHDIFRWDRGWGFGHLAWIDRQGFSWEGQPVSPCVFEVAVKAGELAPAEQARLLKHEIKAAPIQPEKLTGAGTSKDWHVLFCSADPRIWNQEVNQGPSHFARPLHTCPDDTRYLRIRRNSDYVIVPMDRLKVRQISHDGRYGFNGLGQHQYEAHHLGVFDREQRAEPRGSVWVHVAASGWGFGHLHHVGDDQGYCWNGEPVDPCVLEIAVKGGALTAEEGPRVLKHRIKADPIMPEKLEGSEISKDWLVLFRSANPRAWDQEVDDGPAHFARPLAAAPEDLRYLRVRRNDQYVIIPMTRQRLHGLSADGRYGWAGRADESSGASISASTIARATVSAATSASATCPGATAGASGTSTS
jgi:hypothetical protein